MDKINEIRDFIHECGVYYLATVEEMADGTMQPRVRPFGTAEVFEGKLYIQTGKVKPCSQQIAKNPKVEISCFKDGTWLRLAGVLKNDDNIEAKRDMLEKNPSLKAMYSAEDDNTQVLFFESGTATFSSFTAPARVIEI